MELKTPLNAKKLGSGTPGDHQSSKEFRLLVESIEDYGIYMLSLEGRVKTWNSGAQRLHGLQLAEAVGLPYSTFYISEDNAIEASRRDLERALEQGKFETERWRLRMDGSRFWASITLSLIYSDTGELQGYGVVTRDLTERRRAEEQYRLLVECVRDYGIFMLDPKGIVKSWNKGAELVKGYTAQEIIGKHFSTFYRREDIDRGHPEEELKWAVRDGRYEEEGWRVRKDGSLFWANVVITALRDDSGELRGYIKVTRDNTEKKMAEETLKKANEDLESFSYSVSHDLRAPLRSMDGFSEVLQSTLGEKLDERSKNYLGRIRESAQKMAQLIDDLLNLSRLGRAPLLPRDVNLSEIANQVAAELRRSNPDRSCEITVQAGLVVQGDLNLLRVVVENLLGNACKYTGKQPNPKIEFGKLANQHSPTYFVRDNGAGFDMQYKDKLFGAFQRLHGVNEFPGSGIGLATVKRIIHRHGGEVYAQGEPGKGATFFFTLETSRLGD